MAAPTFNKYRSTTIFGNLSVRDLTNSAGSSVIEVASTDLSGNFLSRGDSTFTKKVICNALLADINANNILTTKEYVDSAVGGGSILGLNNTFTGTNLFNNNVDVSGNFNIINSTEQQHSFSIKDTNNVFKINISQIGINQTDPAGENNFEGLTYFENSITQEDIPLPSGKTNTFIQTYFKEGIDVSGNSIFNNSFPTSTLPTSTTITNDSIVNKGMNDTLYSSVANQVKTNTANAFTSTNSFNSNFPTSTLVVGTAVSGDSIPNKRKNDTLYSLVANEVKTNTANAFTSTNTFDTNLPTSIITPTTSTQLSTKGYVDSAVSSAVGVSLSANNTFTGINTFSNNKLTISLNLEQLSATGLNVFNAETDFLGAVSITGITTMNGVLKTNDDLETYGVLITEGRIRLTTDTGLPVPLLNELGYRISGSIAGTIATNTQVNLSQITLPFGIYMVVANIVFQTGATAGNITKYQIGFNNAGTTNFTSSVVGYGGTTALSTTASTSNQLALTTSEVVNITDATKNFRVVANIIYTGTISINTSLSKYSAVRIG